MIRARLLTATAAVALLTGSAAFAQDSMTPPAPAATSPSQQTPAPEAAAPAAPAAAAPVAAAPAAPAQTAAAATPAATNNVVDVLKANGQFTTLLAALDSAQLTDTLKNAGAISIFAPTDAAFAALPEADRTRLMDPANVNELRQTLLYHVIVADVNSSQIEGSKGGVKTAAETEVQLDGTGDAIKVDDATVLTADIDASNGAVFAIDKVLSPAASQVAAGDAEDATPPPAEAAAPPMEEAAPPVEAAPAAPPVEEAAPSAATAPMTEEAAPTPPAAATPPPAAEMAPPAAEATTPPPAADAVTPPPVTSPSGEPAAAVTTTASPPVANPTDGQMDGTATDETESAEPAPDAPQS